MSEDDETPTPTLQRPATLTQVVAAHIRNAILAGEYRSGEGLREVRVASELGTSRGTVREALRALADDGLVDVVPHRGIFVSRITPQKANDVYDLRELLEPRAVRLGVETGSLLRPGYVARVEASLEKLRVAASDGEATPEYIRAERELHRMLYSASGNDLLTRLLDMLHLRQRRILALVRAFGLGQYPADFELHRRLVRDIRDGDPDLAERSVAAHLHASREWLVQRMGEMGGTDTLSNAWK